MSKLTSIIFFLAILILAAFFRFYGLNWDQNQHLHPDERFLTMVTGAISWPRSAGEYFDTNTSPLNPQNRNFGFFVYGTFPLFLTKIIAEGLKTADYSGLTLTGRKLSALFDLFTVILVFLIAKQIVLKSKKSANFKIPATNYFPHLAMFFYAVSVLPIQLSHFYAVDTYLTFFTLLSFFLLTKILYIPPQRDFILYTFLLGISFGLAISAKISAIYFAPIIVLGFLYFFFKNRNLYLFLVSCCLLLVSSFITVRLAYPYLFADGRLVNFSLNPKILDNWKQLKSFDDRGGGFPPAVQWITTKAYLFPLKNLVFWGLGLPLGLLALLSVVYQVLSFMYQVFKKKIYVMFNIPPKLDPPPRRGGTKSVILNLSLLWILILFGYQGNQFVKALRYFYPLYPFLALLSAWFIYHLALFLENRGKLNLFLVSCLPAEALAKAGFLFLVLVYPFSFISIYSRPHTRVTASNWIYQNIPPGSRISGEHWDDYLPLSLPAPGFIHENYQSVEFPLYNEDNGEKWLAMSQKLATTDYIILTSNRLYGSIMTVPEKYPVTAKFYQQLFAGNLGFEKVIEFTSRPNLPLPLIKICLTPPFIRYGIVSRDEKNCLLEGISFVDDYADETFTVYDHPKVLIFKKVKPVDYYQILYQNLNK